jgi:hypothetical protein
MAVHARIIDINNGGARPLPSDVADRQRRLLLTARRRRVARIRRTAETAAWVIGSTLLAIIALGGLVSLR